MYSFAALTMIIENAQSLVPQSAFPLLQPELWPDGFKVDRAKAQASLARWLKKLARTKSQSSLAGQALLKARGELQKAYSEIKAGQDPNKEQQDLWDRQEYLQHQSTTNIYHCYPAQKLEIEADLKARRQAWLTKVEEG